MTVFAVLTVLAVLESTLPSSCLSYKIQHQEAAVTVLAVSAVSAVVAVVVVTVPPLKLNPLFVILTLSLQRPCRDSILRGFRAWRARGTFMVGERGRQIFYTPPVQCCEVLPFLTIQRQKYIKFRVLRAQSFYTALALSCQKGQHLPAPEVYKNKCSPVLFFRRVIRTTGTRTNLIF